MILDVGSGSHISAIAKGDVNIDIRKPVVKISNFVLCDGRYLSFKPNCFDEVYTRHCLEHIPNPMRCLYEMKRVSKPQGRITVIVPHRFVLRERNKDHINKFSVKWFNQAIKILDLILVGTITHYGLFGFPNEIVIHAIKP